MGLLTTLFITTTIQLGLPTGLLSSVCYIESTHNINAISHYDGKTHSYGICQIKLETAKTLGFKGTAAELMKPKINIHYAGKYLQKQILRYDNTTRGIVAYNRGNAKALTRSKYSDRVIKHWGENNNVKREFIEPVHSYVTN